MPWAYAYGGRFRGLFACSWRSTNFHGIVSIFIQGNNWVFLNWWLSSTERSNLVHRILEKLYSVGTHIAGLTLDEAAPNVGMTNIRECNLDSDNLKSYFNHLLLPGAAVFSTPLSLRIFQVSTLRRQPSCRRQAPETTSCGFFSTPMASRQPFALKKLAADIKAAVEGLIKNNTFHIHYINDCVQEKALLPLKDYWVHQQTDHDPNIDPQIVIKKSGVGRIVKRCHQDEHTQKRSSCSS